MENAEIKIASPAVKEVHSLLNHFANILEISPEKLFLQECNDTFNNKKDIPIKYIPSIIPSHKRGLHNVSKFSIASSPKYGTILYQTHNSEIKYLTYRSQTEHNSFQYIIFDKKNTRRLVRHFKKQARTTYIKPILKEDLLDNILDTTINLLLKKRVIKEYGVRVCYGLILSGEPGNGKTLTCKMLKSIALEKNLSVENVTGQEIQRAYGEGRSLDSLFNSSNLMFYDDVDISFLTRDNTAKDGGGVACAILSAMDGITQRDNIVRIFTTNERITNLDPAFLRPGRIDKIFYFDNPTYELRRQFVETWHKEIFSYLNTDRYLGYLLEESEDMSFAEVESIKKTLVTNKILFGGWDIVRAVETVKNDKEFKRTGGETKYKPKNVGFAPASTMITGTAPIKGYRIREE